MMDADGCRCIHLILYSTCERADGCRCIHLTYVPDGCVSFYVVSCHPHHHRATRVGRRERRSRGAELPLSLARGGALTLRAALGVSTWVRNAEGKATDRASLLGTHTLAVRSSVLQVFHLHRRLSCSSLFSPALYLYRACHVYTHG